MKKYFLCTAGWILLAAMTWFVAAAEMPELKGRINDYAGLLTAEQNARLTELLRSYEQESSNQFAVAILPDLGGDDIETYAVRLFEKWKLGDPNRDNGVLLLIALQERRMRIEVGYGLEGRLTDAISITITREILRPALQNKQYYEGIDQALRRMIAVTKGEYQAQPRSTRSSRGWNPAGVILFLIFIFLMMILPRLNRASHGGQWTGDMDGFHDARYRRSRGGWYGGGWGGGDSGGGFGGGGGDIFSGGGGSSGGGGASDSW